jgi:DNA-binding FrmR family transcriptional regulator
VASSAPDHLRTPGLISNRPCYEGIKYCVDILKQTFAIRRAIEKVEALLLEGHLDTCVVDGIRGGRDKEVLGELMELYSLANK